MWVLALTPDYYTEMHTKIQMKHMSTTVKLLLKKDLHLSNVAEDTNSLREHMLKNFIVFICNF